MEEYIEDLHRILKVLGNYHNLSELLALIRKACLLKVRDDREDAAVLARPESTYTSRSEEGIDLNDFFYQHTSSLPFLQRYPRIHTSVFIIIRHNHNGIPLMYSKNIVKRLIQQSSKHIVISALYFCNPDCFSNAILFINQCRKKIPCIPRMLIFIKQNVLMNDSPFRIITTVFADLFFIIWMPLNV